MHIRPFEDADWPLVWPIVREIVRAGDTFTYAPTMTEEGARDLWIEAPPGLTIVATEDNQLLGTAKMGANRPGPGAHIASASFMVTSAARRRGIGRMFCEFAIDWARAQGFAGMQFNAVAASNRHAVALYERLGFAIVGTVPEAFAHPTFGRVALHIMYRPL